MGDRFLYWSQSLAVGIIVPLVFLTIGLSFYLFYKHNDVAVMYKDLILLMMLTALIGGMLSLRSVEPIIPRTPFVLEEYNQDKVEQNVFLDYVVQTNENHQVLETVHFKYNLTSNYIFSKLIDKDEIIRTENRNGYEIKQSKQYTYIMKNKNIIKSNAIDNINEFVNQLNW